MTNEQSVQAAQPGDECVNTLARALETISDDGTDSSKHEICMQMRVKFLEI